MLAIPPTHHSQAIETPAQTHPVQRSSDRHSVTQSALARGACVRRRSARGENGQGTVEYALILVAVQAKECSLNGIWLTDDGFKIGLL